MCHKRVFKAKVVWRGRSQLRRYSRPRDLCRRVYLSSSHRSPLEEAFDATQGMLKVASSWSMDILYLYLWFCIYDFEFVFLNFCIFECLYLYLYFVHVEDRELVIHGSFTINNGTQWQNCPLHFFTIILFANISTDPCFCFWIQRICALNSSVMVLLLCYVLFLNYW